MAEQTSCPSCAKAVSSSDRFCPGCGSDLSGSTRVGAETVVAPTSVAAHCPSCGVPVGADARFCPACGTALQEAATVVSQPSMERLTTDRLVEATTGEFEVLQRIGHGAMGSVYLARDVALSRRVAIKVISPQLLQDETMVARFRLEAQTVAALRHPNIVNLHAVRQLGDLHYFIMDFIDGPSLRAVMKAHAPLDIPVAQSLLFQVGSALSYAHRRGRGVIHRDVKPANVMVDREGNAVVMDFGISKVGAAQSGLTQTGATIGTPEYMSPEQCMDKELTGASDQYALGIVAYEMLTGAVPFKGSTYAIMMAHAQGTPPPIREQRPDCPPEVAAAVEQMLAKEPEDRFPDVEEAVAALGGKPLSHRDPVRGAIIELVASVSAEESGLDESSPLSPVPDSRGPDSITIKGLPSVVEPGDRFDLQVESRRTPGATLPPSDVQWSSSNPAVATVDGGTVLAKAPGSVSLTATSGAVASTVLLTVAELPAVEVSIQPQQVTIQEGGTIPLRALARDRDGRTVHRPPTWISEKPAGASVSDEGVVTALAVGTARISVEVDGVRASATVEVEPATTAGVAAVAGGAAAAASVGAGAPATGGVTAPTGTASVAGPAHATPPTAKGKGARSGRWLAVVAAVLIVGVGAAQVVRLQGGAGGGDAPTPVAADDGTTPADDPRSGADGATVLAAGSPGSGGAEPSGATPVDAPAGTPDGGADGGADGGPDGPAGGAPASGATPSGTTSTPDPVEPPPSSTPAVRSVVISGGARALRAGSREPIEARALGARDEPITDAPISWSSTDPAVAEVRSGELVAGRDGFVTVTAASGGVDASVEVAVLALPSRQEVASILQERVVRVIGSRDSDGTERLLSRSGRSGRAGALLDFMRQPNFSAQLDSMGAVEPRARGAGVDFWIQFRARPVGRGRVERVERFRAFLLPTAEGWALEEVGRAAGGG